MLPLVVAKGCETGADALVIKDSRAQTSENMTGYYINAIAIIYGKPHPDRSNNARVRRACGRASRRSMIIAKAP